MRLFRRRKHPIKRDENGRSARQHAFELFEAGQRPAQVCKTLPMSFQTCCRYFQDYKRIRHKVPYTTIRRWMKEKPEFSEKVIGMLADSLEMPPEEVVTRLQKPWGLLEALKGKWTNYGLERERTEIEDRLMAALEVVKLAEIFGQKKPQFVRDTLRELIIRGEDKLPEE